jgi:hypothetical protein
LAFGEPLDCILMSKDLSSRATRKISITQRDK